MKFYSVILILIVFFYSCRKDKGIIEPLPIVGIKCDDSQYSQGTTNIYDTILNNLPPAGVFGSTFFRQDPILYTTPCFNPLNDYEICYIKDLSSGPNNKELWKYNFCENKKFKIANNIFYSLDWSSKNWILYTGSDQHVYKIKSSGDSLIKLTSSGGIHASGKWSPDGTKFWYIDGGTTCFICDEKGNTITTFSTNFDNIDWIDNNVLLVNWGGRFCHYNIFTQNLSSPIHTFTVGFEQFSLFSPKSNFCFWENNFPQNSPPQFLLKWDFKTNKVDTIKQIYFSYKYISGDFNSKSNKVVLELYRAKWKNQTNDWIQYRNNIILMNPDGSDERILNLD